MLYFIRRKYRILNKFRFSMFITFIFILIYIIFYCLIANAERIDNVYEIEAVYIKPGDTIWTISKKYHRSNMDIRQYIDEIIKYNNLESPIIKPGQIIYLPVHN